MNARVDIAVDREIEELVLRFVEPLADRLLERGAGSVIGHSSDALWVHVDLILSGPADLDHVLEFLVEADAPVGSMAYRVDEHGNHHDIHVLAAPSGE